MRILLATTNKGKLLELQRILADENFEVLGLDQFKAGQTVEESGSSYAENALLKARHWHGATGLATVADDSGLEVLALAGQPGLHSARFAGESASDSDRISRLLEAMEKAEMTNRSARYICAAAFVWKAGELVFHGEVDGEILLAPRGEGGFGYDPVFYYPPLQRTFAEIEPRVKDRVSHRGIAFRSLSKWLSQFDASALDPEVSSLLDTGRSSDRIENL